MGTWAAFSSRMPITLDGHYVTITRGRVAAIATRARLRGASTLLGVPLDALDRAPASGALNPVSENTTRALAARIASALRRARFRGFVKGPYRHGWFLAPSGREGEPPMGILAARLGARSWLLQHVHTRATVPSKRTVNELEALELQYNIGPLNVDLVWSATPQSASDVAGSRNNIREGGVYIQVNPKTGAVLKVGKTEDLAGRTSDYGAGSQFWVGTVKGGQISTTGGGLGTIEKALSRQLISAGGLKNTKLHDSPRAPQDVVGDVRIGNALPPEVKKRFVRLQKKQNVIRAKSGGRLEL